MGGEDCSAMHCVEGYGLLRMQAPGGVIRGAVHQWRSKVLLKHDAGDAAACGESTTCTRGFAWVHNIKMQGRLRTLVTQRECSVSFRHGFRGLSTT